MQQTAVPRTKTHRHSDVAHDPGRYEALYQALRAIIPPRRLVRDPLRRIAYGTDASFYRLVPELVVIVETEAEVRGLLHLCHRFDTPVVFRAAGTSLSGQAVTDSVLAVLGDGWNGLTIGTDASTIRLQPGVIGAEANRRLAPFGRKIGPDPASINAAKIGGIVANNASGMCCGITQNSYRTLQSMRLVLADGTLLDTADAESRAAFFASHGDLLRRLRDLGERVRADHPLADRIRHKFAIKNTTGYSLNALVDFEDPFEILQRLMVGSEGTLGFIAEVTYLTVPEYADKASALLFFDSLDEACQAVISLESTPVSAVELIDRASLRSIENKPGMPDGIKSLGSGATALLVETRAPDAATLAAQVDVIMQALSGARTLRPADFTTVAAEYERYWNIRKGLFPSIGGMRRTGTTVVIEDVAFPLPRLAEASVELQHLCGSHGYDEAILFGHALAGNLHFVFTPDFGAAAEVERYRRFMDAVSDIVVNKYDGSLKAEHGTGRNMAPFVELEWGRQAYDLMHEIKDIFDPARRLNPGVILNDDPKAHLKNLKPLPAADPIVDACTECGFCERMCPSQGLTLTPRQRIVGWREILRLAAAGERAQESALRKLYDYQGIETCAACGLCATACPVGIETGLLTKALRSRQIGRAEKGVADWAAGHFSGAMGVVRSGLRVADWAQRVVPPVALEHAAGTANRLTKGRVPALPHTMPTPIAFVPPPPLDDEAAKPAVVYLPSCLSRTMGPARDDPENEPLPGKTTALLRKAGYRVIFPANLSDLCCGLSFESKGATEAANAKTAEVETALAAASENGRLPIICDTSPCTARLKQKLPEHLRPLDIVEFIHDHLLPRLQLQPKPGPVAVHLTCSARKMGLDAKLRAIVAACAGTAIFPDAIGCCGWAGDKGFTTPELNAHALRTLKDALPDTCTSGYSTSRSCEIGLSLHAERPYRSIVYLVDACAVAPAPSIPPKPV